MTRWAQLEGDADVLTQYAQRLGLSPTWGFVDVLSLEAEAAIACGGDELASTEAIVVIAPIGTLERLPVETLDAAEEGCLFIRQTIDNACGAIALLHLLLNVAVMANTKIHRTLVELPNATARGHWIEENAELAALHAELAALGSTEQPDLAADTELHFVAIVNVGEQAVLLDGRRTSPVSLSGTPAGSFLHRTLAALSTIANECTHEMAILALVRPSQ